MFYGFVCRRADQVQNMEKLWVGIEVFGDGIVMGNGGSGDDSTPTSMLACVVLVRPAPSSVAFSGRDWTNKTERKADYWHEIYKSDRRALGSLKHERRARLTRIRKENEKIKNFNDNVRNLLLKPEGGPCVSIA